eukprot:SAG22_NODE_74_length_22289_cov_65.265119_18_plen_240_part_00
MSSKALPFCCASTVCLAKTVPFHAVPLSQYVRLLGADPARRVFPRQVWNVQAANPFWDTSQPAPVQDRLERQCLTLTAGCPCSVCALPYHASDGCCSACLGSPADGKWLFGSRHWPAVKLALEEFVSQAARQAISPGTGAPLPEFHQVSVARIPSAAADQLEVCEPSAPSERYSDHTLAQCARCKGLPREFVYALHHDATAAAGSTAETQAALEAAARLTADPPPVYTKTIWPVFDDKR